MNGHFHIKFESRDDDSDIGDLDVNGSAEEVKAAIYATDRRIIEANFQCTFGCGRPHILMDDDYEKLGITKDLERVFIRADCDKCDAQVLLRRGEEVRCPNSAKTGEDHCNRKIAVCHCGGQYSYSNGCGAMVCNDCDHHKGLARCYCGWSASGGDGRRELEEMGENIDED